MCGIVGVYNKLGTSAKRDTNAFLKKSLKNMEFRGPDGQKSAIIDKHYATGFARLAIRDLSENGMQPMQTDCGNYTITFNGEIYNTDVLAENLKPFAIDFRSTSDTELMLYHFKHFGFKKTITLLDGIFAIAFYDHEKKELFLARDRAGTKPLYIYNDANFLIYSSHYNQVVKNPFVEKREISFKGLSAYIKYGYVPSNYGFFKKSFLLPQGSYLKLNTEFYSKPKLYYHYKSIDQKTIDLEKTIQNAVQNQLVSDVPVGTFLSGGIDSSIVSMYANKEQSIKAFNIGFSNKNFDEFTTAKEFAKQKNIDFYSKIFDDINFNELIQDNIKAFSEPFSDYSSLPTLLLSQFAKEQVTVTLSGDGGDELFYGYPRNIKYGSQAGLLTSSWFNKAFRIGISKLFKKPLKLPVYEVLSKPKKALAESSYITSVKKIGKFIIPNIKKNIFLDFLEKGTKKITGKKRFLETLRKYEYYYHLQRILIKVDRASMFHSLETRVPLLSNEVIHASLHFDYETCVEGNKGKIPLRNIVKKEVSGDLFSLPKVGFNLPLEDLINNDQSGIFREYILMSIPELNKHLDTTYIEKIYHEHFTMKNPETISWLLWSIFCLKAWYKNHILE